MDFPLEEGNTRPATELYLVTRTRNATRTNLYKLRGTLSHSFSSPSSSSCSPPSSTPLRRNYRNFRKSRIEFLGFRIRNEVFGYYRNACVVFIYSSNINVINYIRFENMNYRKKVLSIEYYSNEFLIRNFRKEYTKNIQLNNLIKPNLTLI